METGSEHHPDYTAALAAELIVARAERAAALAELAVAKAKEADDQAVILRQKVHIEKLQRQLRGQKSERTSRLIAQMELLLEDAEAAATEDELAAEIAVAAAAPIAVASFTRKRPVKRPFPEHLQRERVVVPGLVACTCCGSERLRKLGEDITIHSSSMPSGGALQRMSAVRGDMRNSAKRLPTKTTSVTMSLSNGGAAQTTIPPQSMPPTYAATSMR